MESRVTAGSNDAVRSRLPIMSRQSHSLMISFVVFNAAATRSAEIAAYQDRYGASFVDLD